MLKITVPAPDLVMPYELTPSVMPPESVKVPVPPNVLLAPRVTKPPSDAVPVPVIVPPFKAMASEAMVAALISSVAPLATVVPVPLAPSAAALAAESVPALIVVAPV